MDSCILYLVTVSILWSISPVLYKKAGIYYKDKNNLEALKYLLCGFSIGSLGTLIFVLSTTKCKSLSKNVTYTYAIPIILTTIISKLIYNEAITTKKWGGIGLILLGMYFI